MRRRPDGNEGHTECLLQLGTLVFVLDSLLLALMRMKNLASEYLDFLSSLSLYPLRCLEHFECYVEITILTSLMLLTLFFSSFLLISVCFVEFAYDEL